ncbi:uncharacterized protein LOC121972298 [Zingiber officinale]|uniref:uncharacterized protein LOC121972298 n=1 Tax=Zingiber officinale TaxID=94328 RepID=UPI001C4C1606|nr:uncharacterized protein LOC121972298 [Zingiber officinale]
MPPPEITPKVQRLLASQPTTAGQSGCSQKQVVEPIISFEPQDMEGLELPHDDALTIKAVIANNRVARVFVDIGSSINMLFKNMFEGMQIDANWVLPFFKVLRRVAKFQWDDERSKAFEELKQHLETFPSLFKPNAKEPLWVYLSVFPVVMGQYFLMEIHQPDAEETWKVYVDGSSTQQGSGVGILLISPQEDIIQLAIRLTFRATNNEAEYEALLARLQADWHIGATWVVIYSDSQLVAQQMAGNFEVNNEKLQLYKEAYEKMKERSKKVTVTKVPRVDNQRTDELAKMASSLTTWVLDRSISQSFLIAHIDL